MGFGFLDFVIERLPINKYYNDTKHLLKWVTFQYNTMSWFWWNSKLKKITVTNIYDTQQNFVESKNKCQLQMKEWKLNKSSSRLLKRYKSKLTEIVETTLPPPPKYHIQCTNHGLWTSVPSGWRLFTAQLINLHDFSILCMMTMTRTEMATLVLPQLFII